jgi:hypothetical protein
MTIPLAKRTLIFTALIWKERLSRIASCLGIFAFPMAISTTEFHGDIQLTCVVEENLIVYGAASRMDK